MNVNIVTHDDLEDFKKDLLQKISALLVEKRPDVKWIKAPEVRKLLSISSGTLQNLRINGTLPFTKIGGATYYAMSDIEKVMNSRKVQHQ